MKKLVYILGMLFLYATITYGQGITMTIGSLTSHVGDTVTIPISVTNFNNIGAVSLKIKYSPASLSYVSVTNQPTSGNFTANASAGVLAIGWFGTTPLNIGDGKFLDMKFVFHGPASNIEFSTAECEISNDLGNPLVIDYANGNISGDDVTQLTLPQITAVAGNNISVPLSIENFQNVGAISLKITYDPAVLNFIDVSDQPASGTFTSGASGGVVTIGWYDITPLNVTNGLIANLNFSYVGGSSDLVFNTTQCEISNTLGNPIYAEYSNGRVTFDINNVPTFTLESIVAIPGSDIVLPLNVQKVQNIGAISLKINYNPSVLVYDGVDNAPTTGNFTANASGGVITIGWFDTTPLNVDSAKFVDLKFSYLSGVSDLTFNTALCEVSNITGNPVNVLYNNGSVTPNENTVPNVILPTVQAVGGNDITIPINVLHFQDVGAVSLKINFDPMVLSFIGVENQPAAGNFTVNAVGGVLSIGWFDSNPYGIDTSKLVDVKFHYIGGTSNLAFNNAQCEISNALGNPLFSVFQDGKVEPLPGTVPAVMLEDITAAPGSALMIPLTVNNFQNVGAISLKIQYDPSVLTFTGVANQPTSGNFTSNAAGGVITIGWFDTNPFGLDSVKLVDLKFDFIGGTSALTFNIAQCEVSDVVGTPLFTEYTDGSVSLKKGTYPIVSAGNIAAKVGDTVSVPVNFQNLVDVGAVSIKIQYTPAVLTFIETANQPAAGNFTSNAAGGIITLGWFSTAQLGIDSGKFVDVRFVYNGGGTPFTFLTAESEIAKTDGEVITYVQYINGSVNANVPPQFTAQLPDTTTIDQNQTFTFQYKAIDANIDSHLFFELNTNATGSKLDSLTGIFTWTPTYSQSGSFYVQVNVSDGVLTTASDTAIIIVRKVNRPPVFDSSLVSPITNFEPNKTDSLVIHATDPDGDTVEYFFSTPPPVPAGASINQTTGLFVWVKDLTFKEGSSIPIRFRASDGTLSIGKTITFIIGPRTKVDPEETGIPREYSLKQNYPNPFNPTTKIKYAIPEESRVVLRVFNILGQQVAQLVNEVQRAGYYSVDFNASSLSSGIYLYKIEAKNFNTVKKMILIK